MTLLEYLLKEKISLSEFARRLNKSQPHISEVARGLAHPSFKLAIEIEKITNKNVPRTNWYPNV